MAETLAAQGFRTAAFVANPVLRGGHGFERGFEEYVLLAAERPARKARGEAVVERALRWLDERAPDERLFLWLHFMEPHGPYEPPRELVDDLTLEDFGPAPIPVTLLEVGDEVGRGGVPHYQWDSDLYPGSRDARDYLRRYAGEVRALDRALGAFLAELSRRGLAEVSLLVIASDHGEALVDEHGFFFSHANLATGDQVRTPLLIAYPGSPRRELVLPTSNLDIVPTAGALLGLPRNPEREDGISLLAPARERFVVSQFRDQWMLRRGSLKLRIDGPTGPAQFFDLANDPGERSPLSAVDPAALEAFQRETRRQAQLPKLGTSIDRFRLTEAEQRELEALGYAQ